MTTEEFVQSISLPGEEWRDVVGYEGYYMVSSFGRVASVNTIIKDKKRNRTKQRRVLTLCANKHNGILYHTIAINGKTTYVHRLVATAFLPNPNNYSDVDHIDTNGVNNHVSNLRWCSHQQNQNNPKTKEAARKALLGKRAPWNHTPIVRLKVVEDVSYDCIKDAAKEGFLSSGICQCLKGRSKYHKGYIWMYKKDYESLINMSKNSTTD